jgi:hypothetical protein
LKARDQLFNQLLGTLPASLYFPHDAPPPQPPNSKKNKNPPPKAERLWDKTMTAADALEKMIQLKLAERDIKKKSTVDASANLATFAGKKKVKPEDFVKNKGKGNKKSKEAAKDKPKEEAAPVQKTLPAKKAVIEQVDDGADIEFGAIRFEGERVKKKIHSNPKVALKIVLLYVLSNQNSWKTRKRRRPNPRKLKRGRTHCPRQQASNSWTTSKPSKT